MAEKQYGSEALLLWYLHLIAFLAQECLSLLLYFLFAAFCSSISCIRLAVYVDRRSIVVGEVYIALYRSKQFLLQSECRQWPNENAGDQGHSVVKTTHVPDPLQSAVCRSLNKFFLLF